MNVEASIIAGWRENPVKFVWDNFKVEPDEWQREVLLALPSLDKDKLRISLQACAGPGKSAVLAWIAWWFMTCMSFRVHHRGCCDLNYSAELKG